MKHATMNSASRIKTSILPVNSRQIGRLTAISQPDDLLDDLRIDLDPESQDARNLRHAAEQLKLSDIPVAFPTETVYGLGADATRSTAVKGIYKAKQRPADNPLIVHIASLKQLRALLRPSARQHINGVSDNETPHDAGIYDRQDDPIPEIYRSLISRFWPGPLTIILPNPLHSALAPEVTAGLNTFGARIPKNVLALALIQLAGVPIAAPSANASTKPSPTTAEHVAYDLDGRIEIIIDGGPCDVGVESTVVDGLSRPPLILRPGGVSLEQLRTCPGWEDTQIGYKNVTETDSKPKAPGMKYRHYAPRAKVMLFESGRDPPSYAELEEIGRSTANGRIGVVRTKRWVIHATRAAEIAIQKAATNNVDSLVSDEKPAAHSFGFAGVLQTLHSSREPRQALETYTSTRAGFSLQLLDIGLGSSTASIARWTFSALRELDREDVGTILVEGVNDAEGNTAAAVMNRLRKAAEVHVLP